MEKPKQFPPLDFSNVPLPVSICLTDEDEAWARRNGFTVKRVDHWELTVVLEVPRQA